MTSHDGRAPASDGRAPGRGRFEGREELREKPRRPGTRTRTHTHTHTHKRSTGTEPSIHRAGGQTLSQSSAATAN
ncbi:hypothetical protein GCM10009540_63710 [Streptomyces turgidiscabies]